MWSDGRGRDPRVQAQDRPAKARRTAPRGAPVPPRQEGGPAARSVSHTSPLHANGRTHAMTRSARKPDKQVALALMYGGAGLTVIATLFAFIDRAGLADHIHAGYPAYGLGEINAAVTAYTVILSVVGVLGLLGWLGTVWAARAGKGWARPLASGMFAIAVCIAIAAVTVQDTNGEVGLAPLLGWLQVLPLIPGLAAVMLLWKRAG
ncbi:DUF6264 family protein [Sphaerisporangium sp. NPDC051017]|uniref:DUF6264 family protein n=1 Tax=Sphaerisporangium sp. NPDC051017 TaxID=3154636 RepID=UPI00342A9CD2